MDYNNLRGIESWYKQHREWVKEGRPQKYTAEEKDAIYKEHKVGIYREWQFSKERYQEIVDSCQEDNKSKYRGKVYTWLRRTKPELAHLTWEQIVELNLHKEMYGGIGRGKAKSTHLEDELQDVDYN
jgi:hypothetical protein